MGAILSHGPVSISTVIVILEHVFFGQQLSSMVERNNISGFGCTDNPRRIKLLSVLAFLWNLLDPYLGLNTGLSSGEHCALNFMANCLLDYRCIVCSVGFLLRGMKCKRLTD